MRGRDSDLHRGGDAPGRWGYVGNSHRMTQKRPLVRFVLNRLVM
jgi:hypothetical protein